MSVKIKSVNDNTPAFSCGIKAGDTLVSINSHEINDVLDYRFYMTDKKLKIELSDRVVKVKKDEYEDLGLEFETYLMDSKQSCKNNCVFCFIGQLPKGMRESLYFKDDDARLSFLQGNYITLTNLNDADVDRIIQMKLKVNVSVHTTNPELRVEMMRNKNAGKALGYLYRMADAGVEMNCQLVLCPGINDGDELERSLRDLTALYPAVSSIACVPVGITKYREGLYPLIPFDKMSADNTISIVDKYGDMMFEKYGVRAVYPADEFFLLAEREMPRYEYYGEFEQYENGVGMWASLDREFCDELGYIAETKGFDGKNVHKSVATGKLAAPLLKRLAEKTRKFFPSVNIDVYEIRNDFFGESITVAGLVTGQDIVAQLEHKKGTLGSELIIPDTMLRANDCVFLDDMTVSDIGNALGVKVAPVRVDGAELLNRWLSE